MIGVVDYGLGNVQAILNIYERTGVPAIAVRSTTDLRRAHRIVLPGVGSFDWAMDRLNQSGMRDELDSLVLIKAVPVLGICVGMQMMMERSEEGSANGLGWFRGTARRLRAPSGEEALRLPHMGWNDVCPIPGTALFPDDPSAMRFYFLHSFVVEPTDPDCTYALTDYGGEFPAAIRKGNIFGVQFHPEKSHGRGVALLRSFFEVPLC
jgi:imidazole glycerol-phosphate synthase subunit HisH